MVQDTTGISQGTRSCQCVWILSWRGQELCLPPEPMPAAGRDLGTRKALRCLEHWPWPCKTPLDAPDNRLPRLAHLHGKCSLCAFISNILVHLSRAVTKSPCTRTHILLNPTLLSAPNQPAYHHPIFLHKTPLPPCYDSPVQNHSVARLSDFTSHRSGGSQLHCKVDGHLLPSSVCACLLPCVFMLCLLFIPSSVFLCLFKCNLLIIILLKAHFFHEVFPDHSIFI